MFLLKRATSSARQPQASPPSRQHFQAGDSNRQRVLCVAEVACVDAHAVHEGDVEAAEFAVRVFAEVVEAAALDGARSLATNGFPRDADHPSVAAHSDEDSPDV